MMQSSSQHNNASQQHQEKRIIVGGFSERKRRRPGSNRRFSPTLSLSTTLIFNATTSPRYFLFLFCGVSFLLVFSFHHLTLPAHEVNMTKDLGNLILRHQRQQLQQQRQMIQTDRVDEDEDEDGDNDSESASSNGGSGSDEKQTEQEDANDDNTEAKPEVKKKKRERIKEALSKVKQESKLALENKESETNGRTSFFGRGSASIFRPFYRRVYGDENEKIIVPSELLPKEPYSIGPMDNRYLSIGQFSKLDLTPSAQSKVDALVHDDSSARYCRDKRPMLEVLADAGVEELDVELCKRLPSWDKVVDLYGDHPIVLGLETCNTYQRILKETPVPNKENKENKPLPPMPKLAGLWNTGSSALSKLFVRNFKGYRPDWDIVKATVPWGKHTVMKYKYNNTWPVWNREHKDLVLPVVVVRDPLRWMNSMCHLRYGANWTNGINERCPNLIPTEEEKRLFPKLRSMPYFQVNHTNVQSYYRYNTQYESLADMWSTWNNDYVNRANFPRLIIRMEDTIFFPKQVMQIIAKCSGMSLRKQFTYMTDKGKGLSKTTLVSAMVKYGSDNGRVHENLTHAELTYLQHALDPSLMGMLHYRSLQETDFLITKQ